VFCIGLIGCCIGFIALYEGLKWLIRVNVTEYGKQRAAANLGIKTVILVSKVM
jgi:hypothetical protein